MARDFANLRVDIWGDDDWRELSTGAQWLYELLLTHPTLNTAGVADWRPAKLSGLAKDATVASIRAAADELAREFFVVVDDETEEILVRSYLRHDGVLKRPNVSIAMTKAFASVASAELRGVIVHELKRLADEHPEWPAWGVIGVQSMLKRRSVDPKRDRSEERSEKGSHNGSVKGSENGSGNGQPNGSDFYPSLPQPQQQPTTSTSSKEDKAPTKRGTRLPADWKPTTILLEWAATKAPSVNLETETENFADYWKAKAGAGGVKTDWDATWRTWMRRTHERNVDRGWMPQVEVEPGQEWMRR
jgi:hypothetical protein